MLTGIELDIWRRLKRRFFTPAGNAQAVPVTSTATTLAVVFPRAEVDTQYGIVITPNWLTTAAVTAKTTSGCTVSFGTAAPSGATIDFCTFRSE